VFSWEHKYYICTQIVYNLSMKHLNLLIFTLALAFLVGSCQENTQKAPSAQTGGILHQITLTEKLDTIPEKNTLPERKNIARPMPAPQDSVWYHLRGTFTNNTTTSLNASISAVRLVGAEGTEFSASVATVLYVPNNRMITYIPVPVGVPTAWEAYFLVPKNTTVSKIKVTDLTFDMKNIAYIPFKL
jgi:hypothetical protein